MFSDDRIQANRPVGRPAIVSTDTVYRCAPVAGETVPGSTAYTHFALSFHHHDRRMYIYLPYLQCALSFADKTHIQKGDRFETTCYYDTDLSSVGSESVTFGFGSEHEM